MPTHENEQNDDYAELVDRTVAFRYRGHGFEFDLSQALFSSAGVDAGTRQLLTLIARTAQDHEFGAVADTGCGSGPLGIALARTYNTTLYGSDRDSLAVAWTARNAGRNNVSEFRVQERLGTPSVADAAQTLSVSNLPAKAGRPVLELLLREVASRAAVADGVAGVVVVAPLAAWLTDALIRLGGKEIASSESSNHRSVLFAVGEAPDTDRSDGSLPNGSRGTDAASMADAYVRHHGLSFPGPAGEYRIDTVFGLPEFDGLSFQTALGFDILRSVNVAGRILVRGLGQGHLAIGTLQQSSSVREIVLSERDLLSLTATRHNMNTGSGFSNAEAELRTELAPTIDSVCPDAAPFDWIVLGEDPIGGSSWSGRLLAFLDRTLATSGKVLMIGRSTILARFEKRATPRYRLLGERRLRGDRAALFVRRR